MLTVIYRHRAANLKWQSGWAVVRSFETPPDRRNAVAELLSGNSGKEFPPAHIAYKCTGNGYANAFANLYCLKGNDKDSSSCVSAPLDLLEQIKIHL